MEIMETGSNMACGIGYSKLLEAAVHLRKALELLVYVNNEIVDKTIDALDLTEKLALVWEEINKCRLYTQADVDFEELLIPAMGLVNDAKIMIESLVHWRLGMTLYGKLSILSSIREAIMAGLEPGIYRLESCMA